MRENPELFSTEAINGVRDYLIKQNIILANEVICLYKTCLEALTIM